MGSACGGVAPPSPMTGHWAEPGHPSISIPPHLRACASRERAEPSCKVCSGAHVKAGWRNLLKLCSLLPNAQRGAVPAAPMASGHQIVCSLSPWKPAGALERALAGARVRCTAPSSPPPSFRLVRASQRGLTVSQHHGCYNRPPHPGGAWTSDGSLSLPRLHFWSLPTLGRRQVCPG